VDCCGNSNSIRSCCKLEAVVTVDERGQMVLPKELREKANIKACDKLVLVSWTEGDDVRCIALVKIDGLNKLVQKMLNPIFEETIK
jgi:antitoxin PrlF